MRYWRLFGSFLLVGLVLLASGCTVSLGGSGGTTSSGADGGIWRSQDSGKTFAQRVAIPVVGGKVASIAGVDIRRMVFDPSDYRAIYLATEANGVYYSWDEGLSWNTFPEFAKMQVQSVAVDPNNKCIIYVLVGNRVVKSKDCGRNWDNVYYHQNDKIVLSDIAIDIKNSSILYVANRGGEIIKSENGGTSWYVAYTVKNSSFIDLVMDPDDSSVIYAITKESGIYKTADWGQSWANMGEGIKQYFSSQEYVSLVVDRATRGSLIVASKYSMVKSDNQGRTWSLISLLTTAKPSLIYSVAVNPKNSNEVYYTTATTLVKSLDGGKTWSSAKLPFSRMVNRILINPNYPNIMYFGAHSLVSSK
ncbi:MAG: hypothetical protein WCL61_02725 [bacterium]